MATPWNCSVSIDDDGTINYYTMLDTEGEDAVDVVIEWYIGGELAVRTAPLTNQQGGSVFEVPAFTPTDEYNIKTEQQLIDQLGYGDHTVEVELERV